jgi:hypothetical protein
MSFPNSPIFARFGNIAGLAGFPDVRQDREDRKFL